MNAILVTGATGNVGRPLVNQLAAAGFAVRAVTRRPDGADFHPAVVTYRSATDALPGADAMFVNSRALGDAMKATVDAARVAGVTRLVALSAINADDDFARQPSRFRGDRNKEAEQLVVESGLDWVSLRPTVFATNFAGMWAPQLQAGDVVNGPFATASTAVIAEGDIAAVAAQAFLTDDLLGQRVPLTGPQSLTNAQMVETIGAALGRTLRYQEVPPELVRQRFIALGFGAEFADAYVALLSDTVDRPALVTHDVEKILGRPAESFAHWVSDNLRSITNQQGTNQQGTNQQAANQQGRQHV
jgi:uncharacterized protein YbjT (DUF2867 family)